MIAKLAVGMRQGARESSLMLAEGVKFGSGKVASKQLEQQMAILA